MKWPLSFGLVTLLVLSGCASQEPAQNFQINTQFGNVNKVVDCGSVVSIYASNQLPGNAGKYQFPLGITQEDVQICVSFYPHYCNKIQPLNIEVKKAVTQAAKKDAGSYSLNQIIDAYKWVKDNIIYLNVPLDQADPLNPQDTLYIGSGDCKNQAVVIASMVEAIKGSSRIVIMPECEHAFAQVYLGDSNYDVANLANIIGQTYPSLQGYVFAQKFFNETWLTLDPAGANYPGGVLSQCLDATTQYVITKC